MFSQEELSSFLGVLRNTEEFVEIDCGCTNARYGDTPGKLRAYVDGKLEIDEYFQRIFYSILLETTTRHATIFSEEEFSSFLGVLRNIEEFVEIDCGCTNAGYVNLSPIEISKHHTQAFQRPSRQVIHRDEIVRCSQCNKECGFSLQRGLQVRP
ncbi:hypothetical protein CDL12_29433 [Handroanthus impetiginosus]|uniref:ULTRAPETALA1/2 SAND domain-containing protein n=1 Tax=Handroanthus impetiginosus TaxID=429701 RepID=A0A2G9FYF3_9LAMI|nr:hypothetical protein CDL12_29433 [Handroanthus impetiginosus]